MRKKLILILLVFFAVAFTSCFNKEGNMGIWGNTDEKIADRTFNELITAIESKNDSKIVDIFSDTVKKEVNLSQSALMFLNFIDGDIVSFSSAFDRGIGVDYRIEDDKKIKEIQSAFNISTTEKIYYIAIKECVEDDINNDNVGVLSIYIIESNNWQEDCVYRGDGKWIPGINIEKTVDGSLS